MNLSLIKVTLFVSLFLFSYCKQSDSNTVEKIINDTFLDVADTLAYKYHSFFLIPNFKYDDTVEKNFELNICINPNIDTSKNYYLDVQKILIDLKDSTYLSVYNHGIYIIQPNMNWNKITNTGKYHLLRYDNCEEKKVVGAITFYSPIICKQRAILIAEKSPQKKASVVNGYLLKLNANKWSIEKIVEIQRG